MAFDPNDIEDGVFDSIDGILGNYVDSDAINFAMYGDLTGLNIDDDVETVLQTYTDTHTAFWDKFYVAPSNEYVGAAVSDVTLGLTANALLAQKGLSVTITNELKTLVAQPVTIKTAVIDYFEGQAVKAYVEKATGVLVRSETVLSETTHIPVGKFLSGIGHAVGAYAIFETFKDTITASYNASLGQEDTFSPLREYLIAGTAVVAGGAVAGGFAAATAPAIFVTVGGAAATGLTAWAADTLIGNLPAVVNAAKQASKTLQQTLDDAYAEIQSTINDAWNASGQTAEDLLDDAQGLMDGLLDGAKDLLPDIDLPEVTLPGWLTPAFEPFEDAFTAFSPLVLDLDGDGIEATTFSAATTTTFFDLDGDGYAEQAAWVSADDGLLVRDLDENGTIDDVTELFGSPTIDGFALLAQMDTNGDLVIDANDTDWADLRIWQDANADAVTQDGELLTLASLDIVSIDLIGIEASTSSVNGNPISHTSTFKYDNGSTATIADVWFVSNETNTKYVDDYTLDEDAIFLPTLRGFGTLPALHVAMSSDGTLLGLVEDFVTDWDFDRFADTASLDSDVTDILYQWAGVESVSPTSRGPNVDAQHLEFLEKFFGMDFLQYGTTPNPWVNAGEMLEESWDKLLANLKAQLIIQSGAASLFDGSISYDVYSGEFDGDMDLSEDAINDLVGYATAGGVDTEDYWIQIADFLQHTKGLGNITGTEEGWLDTAIYDSGLTTQTWDDIVDLYDPDTTGSTITGDSSNETINGTTLDDTLTGGGGTDTINGGDGNDVIKSNTGTEYDGDELYGGNGNDLLIGQRGDDILSPGEGGDRAEGGLGDDTYVYTGGDDVYMETFLSEVNDKIVMPAGIDAGSLSFFRIGSNHLLIEVGTLGTILIEKQINIGVTIETIEFDDLSTLDLLSIDAPKTYGTSDGEFIDGITYGAGGDDVIYGLAGDDQIRGLGGSDWIDGGAGNDLIKIGDSGVADTNIVFASPGFDEIYASDLSHDILLVPEPYSPADVHLYRYATSQDHMHIQIDGLGQVRARHQFSNTDWWLDEIQFADESPAIDIMNYQFTTYGTSGADEIDGVDGGASEDDIFRPLGGDDEVSGGQGDDLFYYVAGNDHYFDGIGADTIDIDASYTLEDLSFRRDLSVHQDDLIIYIDGSNSIRLNRQFISANGEWETLRIHDGSGDIDIFADLVVETHGTESNNSINGINFGASEDDIIYGYGGNDTLNGSAGNDALYGGHGADTLNGNDGNDTLDGGAGDDFLRGHAGDDTFIYSAGLDTVQDTAGGGSDILWISGGVTVDDISFANYSTYHTKITIAASVDEITVNYLRHTNSTYHIETLRFDDGFETDQLPDYNNWYWGTANGETLTGTSGANVLIAKDGADTIDAGAGDDDAHGGAGADTLNGEDGDDLLHGGTGDDTLYGDDGLDRLFGGAGADTFGFEAASAFNDVDTIEDFSAGDGDAIDIADVLDGFYTYGVDDITEFVQITDNGTDSTLAIDQDGTANGTNFVAVASILGTTGLTDEAALVSSGNLIVV